MRVNNTIKNIDIYGYNETKNDFRLSEAPVMPILVLYLILLILFENQL